MLICEGGEPGRAAVWDGRQRDIYFQKAIHRVRFVNFVDSHFFVKALRVSADDGRLAEYFTGTGIKHFTGKGLADYLFPLPPFDEQHRIVAKVDELMEFCDRLDAMRSEREATRNRLATASLARLNAPSPDPTTFRNHAAFALENLTPLTTRPDQIKAIRQTILNLAIRGKLVEQDPNDEPASKLMKSSPPFARHVVTSRTSILVRHTLRSRGFQSLPPRHPLGVRADGMNLRGGPVAPVRGVAPEGPSAQPWEPRPNPTSPTRHEFRGFSWILDAGRVAAGSYPPAAPADPDLPN